MTVLLLASLLSPTAATARAGALDRSFGESGRISTPFNLIESVQQAIGPRGEIVLWSGRRLVRYLPNGDRDAGFGVGAQIVLPQTVDGYEYSALKVAVDHQGRIVVFGFATDPDLDYVAPIGFWGVPATWAVVHRFRADGQLDASFGEEKGYVRSDYGSRSSLSADIPLVMPGDAQVDEQGRPVFMLMVAEAGAPPCFYGKANYSWYPRAVVRLASSGAPDPTFGGGDGVSHTSGISPFTALGLDTAGGLTAAVGRGGGCVGGSRVFRLNSDGSPRPRFGNQGSRAYPGLYLLMVEPSGAMLLKPLGRPRRPNTILRTFPDGNVDRSFGNRGRAFLKMPVGMRGFVRPVGVDARRRILVVGTFNLPKPQRRSGARSHRALSNDWRSVRSYLAVGRLTASGRPDLDFGRRGWIITRFRRPLAIDAEAALDPQGRLVVVVSSGSAHQPRGPKRTVLARYLLEG